MIDKKGEQCYYWFMAKDDNQPATKKDVFEIVSQASDLIIKGMEEMFERQDKRYDKKFEGVDSRLDTIEQGVVNLKSGQYELKKSIQDLQVDTPSRGEFNRLKAKVDRHHPTN